MKTTTTENQKLGFEKEFKSNKVLKSTYKGTLPVKINIENFSDDIESAISEKVRKDFYYKLILVAIENNQQFNDIAHDHLRRYFISRYCSDIVTVEKYKMIDIDLKLKGHQNEMIEFIEALSNLTNEQKEMLLKYRWNKLFKKTVLVLYVIKIKKCFFYFYNLCAASNILLTESYGLIS